MITAFAPAAPIALMSDDEVARYARRPDEGFGALTCDRGALPLTAMTVDVRVAGLVASIELAQTFANTTGGPIEATYIFPLPDRAAVRAFRMEVAGRVIEGAVDERGAARESYDAAIAAGQRAAIAEEERPGVFTLRVGNLLAGERAVVRLSLVGPLPVDDGEVTLRFPLVVAPRYIPGAELGGAQAGAGTAADTDAVPDASRITPPVRLPGWPNPVALALAVDLTDAGAAEVASSLHAVTETRADARVLRIQPGERLDRDFILRWRVAPGAGHALRSTLTCADDPAGGGGTFALTLVPPSTAAIGGKPRDVVLLVDRSGSMDGWKMVAARRAAARIVDSLTSRDRFCVIAFDNSSELVPDSVPVEATDRNRFRAVQRLAVTEARGGTELAEPLRTALHLLGPAYEQRERVLVLLTDGQVGNEDQILRELGGELARTRVYTLGIDQAVNAGFLRRLAAAGGGLCELVESEDRLDAVMAKVHRRIGAPVVTELVLGGEGLELDASELAPARLPDVYAGAPVTIFGRYRGRAPAGASIRVSGTASGDRYEVAVVRDPARAQDGAWLAASWARARIRDLEDRYASGDSSLEPAIVAVSKQHGVLSRFTAYLAIDRGDVANPGGRVRSIVQSVETPAGWSAAAAAPGAGGGLRSLSGTPPGAAMRPMMQHAASLGRAPAPTGAPPAPASRGFVAAAMPAPSDQAASNAAFPPPPPMRTLARGVPSSPRSRSTADELDTAPAAVPIDAYLAQLSALATELAARADDDAASRRTRQRLVEWVEDLRSVGGHDALADAVEALVSRLSTALGAGAAAGEARAIATELGALARGGAPVAPAGGRGAFWK